VALDWLVRGEADLKSKGIEDELRLAGALWRYWEVRGSLLEGQARLEQLLESSGYAIAPTVLARAQLGAGVCAFYGSPV
jgi:hypothetical protein